MQEAIGDKEEFLALVGEDLAGMRSQLKGLSDRVGLEGRFYPVRMKNSLHAKIKKHLPASTWRYPLDVVEPIEWNHKLPKAIISVGRRGACVGIALSKKYHLPLIQIQDPTFAYSSFDLILAPEHDGVRTANSIPLKTALHPYTKEKIASLKENAIDKTLGVLLGGSNGRYKLEARDAQDIANELESFLGKHDVQAEILPSRRTSQSFLTALNKALSSKASIKGRYTLYNLDQITGEGNPYPRILTNSEYLLVTQDSVSMISEACATDAEVFVLPLRGSSKRLDRFVNSLIEAERVSWFKDALRQDERIENPKAHLPLDDGEKAGQAVKMLLGLV